MSRTQLMATGQLDSLMDIPLDTFSALKSQNTNITAWFDYSPYAWPDPCSRTFELNLARAPWNDKAMRWALNYGIDRDQIVAEAYQGGTVKSEHFFPLYTSLNRYVNLAKDAGLYNRYPLEEYNPDKARAAIESKGYQRNADGYYEKDGKELTLDITTHAVYEEFDRVAQVLMAQLKSIGIHATHRTEAGGTWTSHFRTGAFEARLGWQTCGSVYEPYTSMDQLNTKYLKPVGEWAFGNGWRWSGQAANQYSAIVDQIGALPLQDPAIDALFVQATEIYLDELPVIPLVQAKKLVPFDTSYWINWPTALNDYSTPTTWWQGAHKIIHNLVPRELTPRFPQNDPGTHSPLITPTLGVAMTVPRPYFDWHDAQFSSFLLTDKAEASGYSLDSHRIADGSAIVSYTLRMDEEVDPGAGVPISVSFVFTTTASSYTPAVDLPNRSYRWTVKAHNVVGYASDWLATQRFSVAATTRLVYLPLVLTMFHGESALFNADLPETRIGDIHAQIVNFQNTPTAKNPPMLAEMVKDGALPPLDQRLPAIPVVVTPTGRIGVYGGTWHTTSWWPQAGNVLLKMYDPPIRWKNDYSGYEPGLAESYEWSPDGKTFTLHLRQGLKWSDGQPYISEDWRFWWEDMATNTDYPSVAVPGYLRQSDGAPITMAFPDSYTVVWSSDTPLWVNPYFMAQGYWEFATSMMKPKHYLMQFHPRYNPTAKYSDLAAADRWWANPDFPTVLSWRCFDAGVGQVTFARNPFYWKVDTEGNQLPYIDYIQVEIVPDETARLQNCAQGRYDAVFRGCGTATDIPFLAANAITGGYHLQAGWVNGAGAWPGYLVNQDYVAGGSNYPDDTPEHAAEIRALLRNKWFRKALSVGFDRQRVVNAAWGGQGFPQQATISPQSPHFASPQGKQVLRNWATSDAQLNVSQANQWLDQLGMLDVNSDGWRELPGGRPFTLTIDLGDWGGSLAVQTNAAADMKSQWEQNLHLRIEIRNPPDLDARMRAGYYMLSAGHVAELDIWTYPDWIFPIQNAYMFPLEGQWYATRGTKGMPPEPNSPAARLQALYDRGLAEPDTNQRHQIVWDAIQIHMDDGPFVIGVAGDQAMPVVLKDNFHSRVVPK